MILPGGDAVPYLRMATVRASVELAQGQITSGFKPFVWKTLRKASQDEIDPERQKNLQFFFGNESWNRKLCSGPPCKLPYLTSS